MAEVSKKTRAVGRYAGWTIVCVAMLAVLPLAIHWDRIWLANRLGNHLEDATDQEIAARLEQLAGLNDAGLPFLVEALHHDSRSRRQLARRILQRTLDEWRELPAEQSAPRILVLVQLLAGRLRGASPESLSASAELALHILAWPKSREWGRGAELTFTCEQILSAARRAGVFERQSEEDPAFRIDTPSTFAGLADDDPPLGLPPQSPPLPANHPPLEEIQGQTQSPEVPAKSNVSNDAPTAESACELISLTDFEVIERVADAQLRGAAEMELQRRGFTPLDIRLARAVSDPDPARREQVVQLVPQLAGIDTRSWLLVLLHDQSPRVRAAAARWLATSGDPQLYQHLRELEQRETDESVRQALRTMPQRK